jgi:heat shock 70kDa protein 4
MQVENDARKALEWLDDKEKQQKNLPKSAEPALLTSDIKKKEDVLVRFASPIVTKPAPASKPEDAPKVC